MSSSYRLFDGLKFNEVRHHRTKKRVRIGDIKPGEGCCGVAHLHHIKWSELENVESGTVDLYVTPFKDMEGKPQGITYHRYMMEELQLWKEFVSFISRMYEKDGESKLRPRDYDITKEHQLFYGFTRKKFWSATSCTLNSWIVGLYGYQGKIVKNAGKRKSDQTTQKKDLINVISDPLWKIIYKKISELCPYDGQPWSVAWATGACDSDQPDFEEEQLLRMRCLVQSGTMGSQNYQLLLEAQHIGLGGTSAVKAFASVLQEKVRGAYRVQNLRFLSLIGNNLTDEHIALLAPVFSKLYSLEYLFLRDNLIEDHGCRLLAHALPRKIDILGMACNRIREHGAEILCTKAWYIDFYGNVNVPQIIKSRYDLIHQLGTLLRIKSFSDGNVFGMLEVVRMNNMNWTDRLKRRESQLRPFSQRGKNNLMNPYLWKECHQEIEWLKWEAERQGLHIGQLEQMRKEVEWLKSLMKLQGFFEASLKEEHELRKRYSLGDRVILHSLIRPAYGTYNGLKGTINSSFNVSRRGWEVNLDNGELKLFEASYLRRLVIGEVPVAVSGQVLEVNDKNICLRMIRLERYRISMGGNIPVKKDFDVAVKTLRTVARNLRKYPGVQKYRELNLQNEALTRRLFRFPDCVRFLNNLGFQKQANKLIMQDEIPSVTAKAIETLAQAVYTSPKKPIERSPRMLMISNQILLSKAMYEPSTLPCSQMEFDGEFNIDGRQNANFIKSGSQTFSESRAMHIAPAEPNAITQIAAGVAPKVDASAGDQVREEEKVSDSYDEDYEAMLMKAVFMSQLPREKSLGREAALVNRSSTKVVKDLEGTPKPDALAVYEQMDEEEEQSDSYEEENRSSIVNTKPENDVIAKIQEGEVQRNDRLASDTDSELQKYLFSQERGAKEFEMVKTKFTTESGSKMKFVAEVYNAPEQKDKDLGRVVVHPKNVDGIESSDTCDVANNFCSGVASLQ